MQLSRTAKYYRERVGREPTRRGPVPRLAPGLNAVHTVPLAAPLPPPDLTRLVEGVSPDGGLTTVWPSTAVGNDAT